MPIVLGVERGHRGVGLYFHVAHVLIAIIWVSAWVIRRETVVIKEAVFGIVQVREAAEARVEAESPFHRSIGVDLVEYFVLLDYLEVLADQVVRTSVSGSRGSPRTILEPAIVVVVVWI